MNELFYVYINNLGFIQLFTNGQQTGQIGIQTNLFAATPMDRETYEALRQDERFLAMMRPNGHEIVQRVTHFG